MRQRRCVLSTNTPCEGCGRYGRGQVTCMRQTKGRLDARDSIQRPYLGVLHGARLPKFRQTSSPSYCSGFPRPRVSACVSAYVQIREARRANVLSAAIAEHYNRTNPIDHHDLPGLRVRAECVRPHRFHSPYRRRA